MKRMLEELYNGNISPHTQEFVKNDEYIKLTKLISEHTDKITKTLDEENLKSFNALLDTNMELILLLSKENFIYGFNLGLKIAFESIYNKPAIESDKIFS